MTYFQQFTKILLEHEISNRQNYTLLWYPTNFFFQISTENNKNIKCSKHNTTPPKIFSCCLLYRYPKPYCEKTNKQIFISEKHSYTIHIPRSPKNLKPTETRCTYSQWRTNTPHALPRTPHSNHARTWKTHLSAYKLNLSLVPHTPNPTIITDKSFPYVQSSTWHTHQPQFPPRHLYATHRRFSVGSHP